MARTTYRTRRAATQKTPKPKMVCRSMVFHGLDRIDQALHELHDVVKLLGLIIDDTERHGKL